MSKTAKYKWTLSERPPEIETHSTVKHSLYDSYFSEYVKRLAANPAKDALSIDVVDGFSGGGVYLNSNNELHYGSPIRGMVALAEAEVFEQARRKKAFSLNAEFTFIDRDESAIARLKHEVNCHPVASRYGNAVRYVNGQFEKELGGVVDAIASKSKKRRCLFVLDQYGYSWFSFGAIKQASDRLPNAEFIMTFMVEDLLDYLTDSSYRDDFLKKNGMSHINDLAVALKGVGDEGWKAVTQHFLYRDIKRHFPGKYFTNFFLFCPKSHRVYWLIHLSSHPVARDVMTELHWDNANQFQHFGREGLEMMVGYTIENDPYLAGKKLFQFEESDADLSRVALRDDICRTIHGLEIPIAFDDFLKRVANDTPATRAMISKVAAELHHEKELVIKSGEGKVRGNLTRASKSDVLFPVKTQKRFSFE